MFEPQTSSWNSVSSQQTDPGSNANQQIFSSLEQTGGPSPLSSQTRQSLPPTQAFQLQELCLLYFADANATERTRNERLFDKVEQILISDSISG
jgi:hypothetical protein